MYKFSKYNYYIKNNSNELLLYNSMMGTKSFCKIPNNVVELFDANEITCLESINADIEYLVTKGIVVKKDEDEQIKLNDIFLNTINNDILSLTILPNESCNFNCVYCYQNNKKTILSKKDKISIVEFVKQHINKYRGLSVSWFGGEPLLNVDIILELSQQLRMVCFENRKIYISDITTNGFLLNKDIFKNLIKNNVLTYQITIDGNSIIHNQQRPLKSGKGSYEKIIENLMEIKREIKSKFFKIIIRINCSKIIMNQISNVVKEMNTYFSNDERFSILLRPVMNLGGDKIEDFDQNIIDINSFVSVYDYFIGDETDLSFEVYKNFLEPGGSVCYAAKKNHYTISSSGEIFKCTCDLNNLQDSKIGRISSQGKFEIIDYKKSLWTADIRNIKSKCTNCKFAPCCLYDFCTLQKKLLKYNDCPIDKYCIERILVLLDKTSDFEIIKLRA